MSSISIPTDDWASAKARVPEVLVRSAQIAQLYSQVRAGMLAAIVAAIALATLLWQVVPHERIFAWGAVFLAVQIPRHILLQRYRRIEPQGAAALPWGRWFLLGSGTTSLLFGMSAVVIFPSSSFIHQSVLVCILGGFAASTAVAQAPLRECYVSSVILALLPLLGRFLYEGGESGVVVVVVGLAFAAALLSTGNSLHRMITLSIRLRFQRDEMVRNLQQAHEMLEARVSDRTTELARKNEYLLREGTERKSAEEALRVSEERYRLHFNHINDMVFSLDTELRLLDASPSTERITGYRRDDVVGKPFHELNILHPDHLQKGLDDARRVLAGERIKRQAYAFLDKEGTTKYAEVSGSPIKREGKLVGLVLVARDITEHRKAEYELRQSREMLMLALDGASMGVWDWDLTTGKARWSERTHKLLGYETDEIEPTIKNWKRLVHPGDWPAVSEQLNLHLQGIQPLFETEHRMMNKSGEWQWLQGRGKIVECVDGKPVRMAGVMVDVTDRKKAEEDLRESEAKYRTLVEFAPDGVFVQVDDRIEYANSAMAAMMRADSPNHLIGMKVLDLVHPEFHETIRARMNQNLDEGEPVPLLDQKLVRLDGSVFEAEAVGAPVSYRGQRARQVLVRDVTDRKKTEGAIKSIVEGVSGEIGEKFFESSVVHFADILDADFTLMGEIMSRDDGSVVRTIAFAVGGELQENFEYSLKGAPCEEASKRGLCSYPRGVALRFPQDKALAEKGVEAYVGVGLYDSRGEPMGIMAAMYKRPLEKVEFAEAVLRIFASRAAAEIERTRAEEALRSSEERLRLAWETSPDALSISRMKNGTYVDVNEGYTFLTGYTRGEVIGKSALDLPFWADPQDRKPFAAYLKQHGHVRNFETKLLRRDGEIRSILVSAGLMMLNGESHLLAVTKDIEDLKRAEVALRESEQKYRLLAENASDVIWIADLDLRFAYVSPSVERMYGWAASEWLAFQMSDYLPQSSLDMVLEVIRDELSIQGARGVDPNRVRRLELEQYRKDGTTFWTEVTARFLYDDKGGLAGIIGATRDITERRQSQEQLQRLSAAVQQAGETIMITEPDGTVLYVNPSFEKTTGYPLEEVEGKTPEILKSGEHDNAFYEDLWATIRRGEVWRGRFTNKKRDGSLFEEAATISPIKDESGQVAYYVMVSRDLTSEIVLQKQLNQAQKMEAIGTLAGGIAHDFNNLLQAILGYSDLLLMEKGPGDPDRKKLQVIQQSARDGADLVARILTFSRKADTKARPVDLNEVIRKAQRLLRRTIPRMIDIELVLADNLRIIDADPGQVEQVLLNLAVNAYHAMRDGGQLLIETSNVSLNDEYLRTHLGAESGQYVLLTLSDTGVGMPRDVLDRIFDPFFTTKTDGEGTGLGLSMVHGIVSQHGGYIRCYSEPGRGTSFKIYLPVSASERIYDVSVTREMPAFGTETILLVDDDNRIREMARQMIGVGGYDVLTARSGEEALEMYASRSKEISLVVLDLIMPGMGGKRCLVELLRTDPDVKVLVASGYASNGLTLDEKGSGARGFISKPYDAKDILSTIRKVLDEGYL
jgi:PAS domain S-box-containing protein